MSGVKTSLMLSQVVRIYSSKQILISFVNLDLIQYSLIWAGDGECSGENMDVSKVFGSIENFNSRVKLWF